MRKVLLAAAAVASLTLSATAASAAALVTTPSTLTPPASGFFGNFLTSSGNFADSFTFTIGGSSPAATDSQVSTFLLLGTQNVSFAVTAGCPTCGIWIDGTAVTPPADPALRFVQTQFDPLPETWALNPVVLAAGSHTIFVNGSVAGPTGSYSGTINVQAVPEPATWAMMLIGFAGVGLALRRRRRPVLAQIA